MYLSILFFDKSNPIYKGERVGENLTLFNIYKFKSMKDGSDKYNYSTTENDHRVTRLGKFIRKTSLDELPQLFNVLIGNMSLIGPRPDHVKMKTIYSSDEWELRHMCKPGITGLAQVSGRNSLSVKNRKKYDLFYTQNINIFLDIFIYISTIKSLLFKRSY